MNPVGVTLIGHRRMSVAYFFDLAPIISEQKPQAEVPYVLPIRKTSFILREDYFMNLKMLAAKKRTTVSALVNESLSLLFQINTDLLK